MRIDKDKYIKQIKDIRRAIYAEAKANCDGDEDKEDALLHKYCERSSSEIADEVLDILLDSIEV